MSESLSFKIRSEVPASYMERLLNFIYVHYLLPQTQRFSSFFKEITPEGAVLSYLILDTRGNAVIQAKIRGTTPLDVTFTLINDAVPLKLIEDAKQDIVIAVHLFEEQVRRNTLYFAWREGERLVPEEMRLQRSFNRLLLETQILLFTTFIILGMFLFAVIGTIFPDAFWVMPIVLLSVQFFIMFYSSKLITRTADWGITEANPTVHFLEYRLPFESHGDLKHMLSAEKLAAIKKEVYDEILMKQGEIDCESTRRIFEKYGILCQPENLSAKKVNVYALVKKVATEFDFPMPNIVVSNTMVPNAAAAGPSPSRGVVLLTTGLLIQLEENEILSVLGHEFGHLKGRDPLILFGLTSAEFVFRFYVLFPLFPILFSSFFFFIYFWFVMTIIFFIAKFFEARADLVSAVKTKQPEALASALEKIGFQRLLYERAPSFRRQEWLRLDAHPPVSFRLSRLRQITPAKEIKYPLIQSIRDVIAGFVESF
ncbi:MAG: M48 family metalloprotease [Candidatus Bathyarchaeia archaeon]